MPGEIQVGLGMGVPGHHEDLVKRQLSADPRCPTGLFSRKAVETTLTDLLGFVCVWGMLLCGP